ncbi:hypothetical protein BD324DRAFT_681684 [Kockovaella imperatae]|uniref:Uncharacterized protein n=1 Tax=Kockovaella imperatae TaxID=4999 RepID=A0A1Y1UHG7_9TREE|nr:hypothetical protein BD324DRAFT_681684 [Kockovaella imperatae]ORX36936.1 hypothetical protein BD324DRAFT_681684 [Kockovaella imperatae]
MADTNGSPGPQTQIRLYRQRASYEVTAAREIFRSSPVAHVAFVHPGDDESRHEGKTKRAETVMNLPLITVIVPEDDEDESGDFNGWNVYFHTHRNSGLVEAVERGSTSFTATTTIIDGLVLSPTAHDHSLNYRSATLHLSSPSLVTDHEEKRHSLGVVTDTVAGYTRTDIVGQPMDPAVERTTVIRCKIVSVSCKQRCGGWDSGKEPAIDGDEGNGHGWKGGIPCWTQWGDLAGYGRDGEELKTLFAERSRRGQELAVGSLYANENSKLEGLGKRLKR